MVIIKFIKSCSDINERRFEFQPRCICLKLSHIFLAAVGLENPRCAHYFKLISGVKANPSKSRVFFFGTKTKFEKLDLGVLLLLGKLSFNDCKPFSNKITFKDPFLVYHMQGECNFCSHYCMLFRFI